VWGESDFGRVEYMLVSIRPSTFLDEVHHATPGSSFDETGNFIAYWAIELMAGILIVLIVSPLRGRSVWGGGVCYRYVGLLGLNSQAAIESCYTHRGQRFGCRLYCHCPTLALVG
jgi:hypothetical protein